MKTQIKSLACLAWSAVAIWSAKPADALVSTTQSGSYAACTGTYSAAASACNDSDTGAHYSYNYNQLIKFSGTVCNSGTCTLADLTVKTDFILTSGRKPVQLYGVCNVNSLYILDTCNC